MKPTFTTWRKSARSDTDYCVEVSLSTDTAHVGVRDSKQPGGPELAFTREEWTMFLGNVAQ